MGIVLAVIAGVLLLGLGIHLAILLHRIRRQGYGEGRTIEIPELGISLRYPHWWSVETADGSIGPDPAAPDRAALPFGSRVVRMRTGNHAGALTIGPVDPSILSPGGSGDPARLETALGE